MIVRVFRARVRPNKQAEFQRKAETLSIPLVQAQKGLVAYYPGKPIGSNTNEFTMVTIWDSLESLQSFAGENWERAVIPEEEIPLLEETSVHHYEIYG